MLSDSNHAEQTQSDDASHSTSTSISTSTSMSTSTSTLTPQIPDKIMTLVSQYIARDPNLVAAQTLNFNCDGKLGDDGFAHTLGLLHLLPHTTSSTSTSSTTTSTNENENENDTSQSTAHVHISFILLDRSLTAASIQLLVDSPLFPTLSQLECNSYGAYVCQIGAHGAAVLSDALRHHSSLWQLVLDRCDIGDQGAQSLADVLQRHNRSITELWVQGNNIGPIGVHALCDALTINDVVREMALYGNPICDSGADHLAQMLRANSSLTTLRLGCDNIGPDGLESVAGALTVNLALQTLSGMDLTSSSTLKSLMPPKLKFNPLAGERNNKKILAVLRNPSAVALSPRSGVYNKEGKLLFSWSPRSPAVSPRSPAVSPPMSPSSSPSLSPVSLSPTPMSSSSSLLSSSSSASSLSSASPSSFVQIHSRSNVNAVQARRPFLYFHSHAHHQHHQQQQHQQHGLHSTTAATTSSSLSPSTSNKSITNSSDTDHHELSNINLTGSHSGTTVDG